MTLLAFLLVLASAILHATWNFFSKRVPNGGLAFIWLFSALTVVVYAPLAIGLIILDLPDIGWQQVAYMSGSSLFHLSYFAALLLSYRAGDLSLVYPISRSSGPVLAIIGAVLILHEPLTWPIGLGATVILTGSLILTGNPLRAWHSQARLSIGFALLTGLTIAGYSLWDKVTVSSILVPPILLDWFNNLTRTIALAPYAKRHWGSIQQIWQQKRLETWVVALLGPLSYILLLTALVFSPLTLISPLRQISIVIGTWMGSYFLAERQARRRLVASVVMVAGVMILALA